MAPGNEVPEFTAPVDGVPMVPTEVPKDPALMLPLPATPLTGAWVIPAAVPGRLFKASSEHGTEVSAGSVVVVQARSTRSPDPSAPALDWASAEPASSSAASEASETAEDLFTA